jgi:type I restriction enzyme S subunit
MTDISKLITDNIDVWSNAVQFGSNRGRGKSKKLNLHGIKKLRDLILELAVHGKLVPQSPTDEPASILLERIANEKKDLIKQKLIKKPKILPELTSEDLPYSVPNSWTWCRLQDVSSYIQRGKGPKYDDAGKVRVISQKCIQWSGFDIDPAKFVNDESLEKYQDERYLQPNDLLWNSTGTGTVGRINVLEEVQEKTLVADSHVTIIRTQLPNPKFIWIYISAPGIQGRIEPDHENALVSGSTKQVELNTSSVMSLEVPIPPLEEQQRIVDKVNELMALCDQLEQQTEASIDAHQLLVEELLSTLFIQAEGSNSENAKAFEQNWARIVEHFDLLFTTEHSIEQLKQTILQLAVMGKLVPQDPTDEPASKLLERIEQEKEQLIKDKVIKRQKALPSIAESEKVFSLPIGWEWERFGNVYELVYGDNLPKPKRTESGEFNVYGSNGVVGSHNEACVKSPCIVIGRKGSAGALNKSEQDGCWVTDVAYSLTPFASMNLDFIFYQLHTCGLDNLGKGIKPGLNRNEAYELCIAIPPIEEQQRIVNKVVKLLELCDLLKNLIIEGQNTQQVLATAIVGSVLGRPSTIKLEEKEEKKAMNISTELSLGTVAYDKTAILAPLIGENGADAKSVWSSSGLKLPEFYRQLKLEITVGFVAKPAKAEFEG